MQKEVATIDESFSIKLVQNLDEFMGLKNVWNSFTEKAESHVSWLCQDWFNLCLKYFQAEKQIFILLLFKNSRIVAIFPLIVKHEKFRGMINLGKIELIGNTYSPHT